LAKATASRVMVVETVMGPLYTLELALGIAPLVL
jgi:hypothetical protein